MSSDFKVKRKQTFFVNHTKTKSKETVNLRKTMDTFSLNTPLKIKERKLWLVLTHSKVINLDFIMIKFNNTIAI